jgi:plastocyanin
MCRLVAPVLAVASAMLLVGCSRDSDKSVPPSQERSSIQAPATPSSDGIVLGTMPVSGATSAFVLLTPRDAQNVTAPDVTPVMDQVQLSFIPHVLIVRTGYPVLFRSSDEELHNLNVKNAGTRQQEFNVAIPPDGTFEHTFNNAGFYDVNCDIHPSMSAQIVVASTPYVVVPGPDGRFTFENVAPGSYTLTVYAGTERFDRQIQVTSGRNDVQVGAE